MTASGTMLSVTGTHAEQVGCGLVAHSCTTDFSLPYGSHSILSQHCHDWCWGDSTQGAARLHTHTVLIDQVVLACARVYLVCGLRQSGNLRMHRRCPCTPMQFVIPCGMLHGLCELVYAVHV